MADLKITQFSEDTTPTSDDLITTVNDPAGTPANKKMTLGNVVPSINSGVASVATSQSTSSASLTDLTTTGPAVTVTVTNSGKVLVIAGSRCSNDTVNGAGVFGVDISGANTVAAADWAWHISSTANADTFITYSLLLTGLTAGSTTFTMKYRKAGGSNAAFSDRRLTIIPL